MGPRDEPLDVRGECRKYAEKYLNLQREQFKRIGVFCRWEKPYSTMATPYEAVVLETPTGRYRLRRAPNM